MAGDADTPVAIMANSEIEQALSSRRRSRKRFRRRSSLAAPDYQADAMRGVVVDVEPGRAHSRQVARRRVPKACGRRGARAPVARRRRRRPRKEAGLSKFYARREP